MPFAKTINISSSLMKDKFNYELEFTFTSSSPHPPPQPNTAKMEMDIDDGNQLHNERYDWEANEPRVDSVMRFSAI